MFRRLLFFSVLGAVATAGRAQSAAAPLRPEDTPAQPADPAPDAPPAPPDTFPVVGAGFGHGVGMCQWGARGQAERGLSHVEILKHYYRGAEVKRIY